MKKIIQLSKVFFEKNLILICCVFSILPFVIISYFNNPYADDYCYAYDAQRLGFLEAQKFFFNNLNGRYSVSAILSFDILHSEYSYLYKLFPIILIFIEWIALFSLIKTIFNIEKLKVNIVVSLSILVLYITQMPIVSEGFYWLSAAVNYQLANILSILLMTSIVLLIKYKNFIYLFFTSVLIIILGGFNETTLFMLDVLIISILGYKFYCDKKINFPLLIILILLFSVSFLPLISSGNSIRTSRKIGNSRFVFSSIMSFAQLIWNLVTKGGITLFFSIIIFNKLKNFTTNIENLPLFKVPLKIALPIFLIVIVSGYFTGFWAIGEPLPPRARNTVFMFFILGFIYISFLIFIRTPSLFSFFDQKKKMFLMFTIITISFTLNGSNFITVSKDLFKKKAYNYNNQFKKRIAFIKSNLKEENSFELEPFSDIPETLVFRDLDDKDTYYVYNYCFKEYWGLESVTLQK